MTKAKSDPVALLLAAMAKEGLSAQIGGEFDIHALSSGIASFDQSTGVGGFPRGRVSVIQGEEASGKTLLALAVIAVVQQGGGRAGFVDLEHALTPSFAQLLGVDYDDLVISRPRTLNEAYDVARALVKSGLFHVVVFDSAVALATLDELDKSAREGQKRAGKAQVHAEELPKIVSLASMTDTAFLIINQLRENPNPPSWHRGGKILYSPGGRTIRHISSLIVDVSMAQPYRQAGQRVGHRTKTYIRKNKVGIPYLRAEFDMMYATGIDMVAELISTAIRVGLIKKSSSWFMLEAVDPGTGEQVVGKWNGRAALDMAVKDSPELHGALYRLIQEGEFAAVDATTEAGTWDMVDAEE